jgi:GNAT superfamily N-acetyltransferase
MDGARAHLLGWLRTVGTLPGATSREQGGVAWVTSDIGWPMFNGAVALTEEPDREAVAAALDGLWAAGVPWFWFELPGTPPWVLRAVAAAGASVFDERLPWMECPRDALPAPVELPNVVLEEASDEASWRRWAATLRAVYGFPEAGETCWAEPARRLGWSGVPWRCWTALLDGRPAGVTLLVDAGGVASLLGVGVFEDLRRRGLGRLLTLAPLAEATSPLAGFWATEAGAPLYASLGFRENGWITRWLGGMA